MVIAQHHCASLDAADAADRLVGRAGHCLLCRIVDLGFAQSIRRARLDPGDVEVPTYSAAVERVGRTAQSQGKAAGVLLWNLDQLPRYADVGYTVIAIGSDGANVASSARAAVEAFRQRLAR